jgi:acetyl-CoA carboxylase carboxyl transferase subunit alpha
MIRSYLEFERPIEELELKIDELKRLSDGKDIDISGEIKKLEKKVRDLRPDIFSSLLHGRKQ